MGWRSSRIGSWRAGALALAAVACAAPPEPDAALERFEYRRVVMGVEARIVAWAPDEEAARAGCAAGFERMLDLEHALSDHARDSEATRLAAAAGGPPVAVSADLYDALELAVRLARASDGALDVTVGPLTRLWREARRAGGLPDEAALAAAHDLVGWRGIELDAGARTARLARPGMALDFGAVGKGLAADAALAALASRGLDRALVEVGGDLVCGAPPPGRAGWRVRAGCGADTVDLELAREAVATSGDAEQFVEVDGARHSHVLDPRTGRALVGGACTSAVAPTGAAADALASLANVLGPEGARAVAARLAADLGPARIVDHGSP